MNFKVKLDKIVKKNKSLLCIGLDSDFAKIPQHLQKEKYPQFTFNQAIIDATYDLVCAYKPNSAFYEAEGITGLESLKMTCDYLRENYPEIPIILDAKRGDIASTNESYAKFVYDYLKVDALTVHPYLGKEALKPFLDRKEKGIFVLCRTSNPGAVEFQDLKFFSPPRTEGRKEERSFSEKKKPAIFLYQIIAEHVATDWNYHGNCGLVIGATYPTELKIVRHIVGDGFPLLIPGVGIQGGDLETVVQAGVDKSGLSAIINVSRSVIFASSAEDFAQKARAEVLRLKKIIGKVLPAIEN